MSDTFDAIVVASFGGPEAPEDVRPFLENVTRGRGIPPERLDEVGAHYSHFGGVSPLNGINREIVAKLQNYLQARGCNLPVYFGNRNWHPFIEDTTEQMARDGVKKALVFATSAWGGYSGCRQYHEDIQRAREAVRVRGLTPPDMTKMRQFYDHPLFVQSVADEVKKKYDLLTPELQKKCRLVFTAHSIPLSADTAAGRPEEGGHLYSRQVMEASQLVAEKLGFPPERFDVVWQSRSGPPQVPWLEPDICDHVTELHGDDVPAVLVCPIGFLCDHVEVVWDLDTELAEEAEEFDMVIHRINTIGLEDSFISMLGALIAEYLEGEEAQRLGELPQHGCNTNGRPCYSDCCVMPKRPTTRK